MNSKEKYNEILKEIEKIENDQLMNEEKYYEIHGEPEDYSDFESMNYYFYDIEVNLPWRYKNLYYKIAYFLDSEKLIGLLDIFNKDFKNRMFHEPSIKEVEYNDQYDVSVPILIGEIRTFFYSLYSFYIETEEQKNTYIDVLEKILGNASFALKKMEITKEKDFFDNMEKIIRMVFPSSQKNPRGQYIKKLKTYIPDIFIPECNSLIELKYADSDERLKKCMEEIDTDEKGYTDNPKYSHYYAVFYLTEMFVSKDELKVMWDERNHPKEWKYFPVYKIN